jgi:hypothetical protein
VNDVFAALSLPSPSYPIVARCLRLPTCAAACLILWIPAVLAEPRAALSVSQESSNPPTDSDESVLDPRSPARKELLSLIGQLEVKLPRDLARKLIVISMKLATGYCSPYPVKELEEAIEALPGREQKLFEKEWKMVREHKHWPCMPRRQDEGRPAGRKSPSSTSERKPS